MEAGASRAQGATGTHGQREAMIDEQHVNLKTPNVGSAFTLFPPHPGGLSVLEELAAGPCSRTTSLNQPKIAKKTRLRGLISSMTSEARKGFLYYTVKDPERTSSWQWLGDRFSSRAMRVSCNIRHRKTQPNYGRNIALEMLLVLTHGSEDLLAPTQNYSRRSC